MSKEDESSLHIVDFLVQNCQGDEINNTDTEGHTALHFAGTAAIVSFGTLRDLLRDP